MMSSRYSTAKDAARHAVIPAAAIVASLHFEDVYRLTEYEQDLMLMLCSSKSIRIYVTIFFLL
jgi:hypothetical protein